MELQGINTYPSNYGSKAARAETAKTDTAEQQAKAAGDTAVKAKTEKKEDKFVKGDGASVTYANPKSSTPAQLKALEEQRVGSFTKMLQSMVARQGQKSNLTLFGVDLNVTVEDSRKAAAAIAEGGEYSVDAVAGRIMDMAKALAGGDESKISVLRGAVEKGFKAAGVELGQKLPSICDNTYDEVMKRFDDWEKGSKVIE